MRFQVPQFIGVEDKLFGPLTLKQFIYLAGGAGMAFVLYDFLNFYLALLFIVPVAVLALALAFYKVNDKPFINILEAALKYFFTEKLYLWKKTERAPKARAENVATPAQFVPSLSESRLKDLTWSLDINNNVNAGRTAEKRNTR